MTTSSDIGSDDGAAGSRLAGLDGLRAIAVTAVILYHAELGGVRGGFLGVDLFFVISGFLITHLLAGEIDATGGLNLSGFYWRRAKRLLPASWLMTACAIVAAAILAPDALARLRSDATAALFYVTNWELLAAKVSYFESVGRQPLLLHLWSLAIEEQFYILWAPLLLFGLRAWGRLRMALFTAGAAALAVAWTAWLANRGGYLVDVTATRLDFGTDSHLYPLLIGALLGLAWRPRSRPDGQPPSEAADHAVFTLGLAALGALVACFLRFGEETPNLYPFGFLAAAVASAGTIVAATWPGARFGRWLDQQPLRWIGERSYGLYLWHWPVFMLLRPEDLGVNPWAAGVVRIAVTLAAAALSYRFVEAPVREGLIDRILTGLVTRGERAVSAAGAIAVTLIGVMLFSPLAWLWRGAGPLPTAPARALAPVAAAAPAPAASPKPPAPIRTAFGPEVTAVGDSVLLGAADGLRRALPGVHVYAHVGWQARDVIGALRGLSAAHALTPVVVIHLGTNGYVYEPQLREILTLLTDRERVVLVNSHVPRRWMEPNNALFDRVARDYPNTVLADWRRISDGQDHFFVADGFHLTRSGQAAYVGEMMRAGHLAGSAVEADRRLAMTPLYRASPSALPSEP